MTSSLTTRFGSIAKPLADGAPSGPGSEPSHDREGVVHRTNLNSEVNLGEVAFPQRSSMKRQVLYQGTASAVPERDEPDGLQPLGSGQGLKPSQSALSAARLKPCPDTRRPISEFGIKCRISRLGT